MSLPYRLFNMIRRMTVYGLVLGGAAGLLVALSLLFIPTLERPAYYGIPLEPQVVILWSTIFGVLFGTIAGFTSGVGMAIFTGLLFRDMPSVTGFRLFTGSTTFMLTIATFVGRGLWNLADNMIDPVTWNATMLMSVVIAVYASQRTATKYLLESSVEKAKIVH